ncbi:MAG TPA: PilZ domain-containing protein [Saliniramus sp.]|nr:PilZ domain-containing protein [Saliniramus sp.]
MDLNVRQRLAKIRRNFLTLSWASAEQAAPASEIGPDLDLVLEDTLAGYHGIGATSGVDWRRDNPGLFDDDDIAWSPSPQTRAAVFRLAEKVRGEGERLVELSAHARREADRLLREHASATARALAFLEREQESDAGSRGAAAEAAAALPDWTAHFADMNELIREIGTTALSAALSAVRAGASTRGFSQVAKGIDELERALRSAWDEIERLIVDLEDRAAETAATAANLRSAGKAFMQNAAELPHSASTKAGAAAAITGPLGALKLLADKIARTGGEVAAACDEMAHLVHTLAEQLVIVVRETPVGNRRAARRIAFESSCIISTSERSYAGKSLDLSATGALVKLRQEPEQGQGQEPGKEPVLQRGQPITLHLQDIAPIVGSIAGVSAQGVHISFDLGHGANAEARPALLQMLDGLLARSHELVNRTTLLARDCREALEMGLADGRIAQADLLSTEYEPIAGAEPPRFTHPALAFYEEALTPIIEAVSSNTPNVIHAAVMDRAGFVPVHTSSLGRDSVSRRGRISTDLLNQRAARNLRPFLIQVVPHDPTAGENGETVRSVCVPIFVGGRHWGCAEIGFRLEDGDAALSTVGV